MENTTTTRAAEWANYCAAGLVRAETELTAARAALSTAKTSKARRDAFEQVEFWSNKTAFYANANN